MNTPPGLSTTLDGIASSLEGVIPATICSCSADGTPNVTYLSVVHRVDETHVGLSYQFFNKTRQNVLDNPRAQVVVVSPETLDQFRLDLQYERTETAGAAFDHMGARLAAVASQTGMSRIFKLRGVDVYRVLDCRPFTAVSRTDLAPPPPYLAGIESLTAKLAVCADLEALLRSTLAGLATLFGYAHCFVMVPDESGERLYTVASYGYNASGIGSEVSLGDGILGVAAARRMIVRTASMTRERVLSRAVRASMERRGQDPLLEREIALPGLSCVESQVAAPLVVHNELLGILCIQSPEAGRFMADDERALQIVARQLAAMMMNLRSLTPIEQPVAAAPRQTATRLATGLSTVRHYQSDDSVFVADAYLIKGVAGRILWKLLRAYQSEGRILFSNREIRLDASLRLPDIKDNLEARLILLRRRLEERCDSVRLIAEGRGRLRLEIRRPLALSDQP